MKWNAKPVSTLKYCKLDRFLHTRYARHMLASLANCSVQQINTAIDIWVPRWFDVAKVFTRFTWLGSHPDVFAAMQPLESADARRKRQEKARPHQQMGRQGSCSVTVGSSDGCGMDDAMDDQRDTCCDNSGPISQGDNSGIDLDSRPSQCESDSDDDRHLDLQFVSLDGKVFPLDKFNRSYLLNRACFSSKTGTSGLQALVWSLPCGIPIVVTGLFGAQRHGQLHSGWLVAVPKGVDILQDRGFRGLQRNHRK